MLNKHITTDNLKTILPPIQHAIDKKAETPDWNENDSSSKNYIKNRPFYTWTGLVDIIGETEFNGYIIDNEDNSIFNPFIEIIRDDITDQQTFEQTIFTVFLDGVEYKCKGKYFPNGYNSALYLGNGAALDPSQLPNTGEPFCLFIIQFGGYTAFTTMTDGNHTFSVKWEQTIDYKIDKKYLPKMIGEEGTGENAEVFNGNDPKYATGEQSHAEGHHGLNLSGNSGAHGLASHAEGYLTIASGEWSHAEGGYTTASGECSHAEGYESKALGRRSHAEGDHTTASGEYSHAEGQCTRTGNQTIYSTTPQSSSSYYYCFGHAEGYSTLASGTAAHAEGQCGTASGRSSHVEGELTVASGSCSHAEGYNSTASGDYSHAEGYDTKATGFYGAHAEGSDTTASGNYSHAEGWRTTASGNCSHAEGYNSTAFGANSHAQGESTQAKTKNLDVIGMYNFVDEPCICTIGTQAGMGMSLDEATKYTKYESFIFNEIEGIFSGTKPSTVVTTNLVVGDLLAENGVSESYYEIVSISGNYLSLIKKFVQRPYATEKGKYVHVVGNGTSSTDRSNAHTLDWNGNAWFAGTIKLGGTGQDDDVAVEVATTSAKSGIVLTDEVTGDNYIISMRNGSITSRYATKSIEVTNMPTKTEYFEGEYFDPTGMTVIATLYDGTTVDVTDYIKFGGVLQKNATDMKIIYVECGISYATTIPLTVKTFDPAVILVDFTYTSNNNGTYTITGWKKTLNGVSSTEMVIPNNALIVV